MTTRGSSDDVTSVRRSIGATVIMPVTVPAGVHADHQQGTDERDPEYEDALQRYAEDGDTCNDGKRSHDERRSNPLPVS